MRAKGEERLRQVVIYQVLTQQQARYGDVADARCGFPSSNDLINPFYVLSWRRLRLAGNAGGCDLGPAACLRLSAFAFAYSPGDSYSNSNSGRGTEPSFIDCAISCTNDPFRRATGAKAKETQGDFVFKFTTAARSGAEAEDGASLGYSHTHRITITNTNTSTATSTLSICLMDFQIFKQLDKHAVARTVICLPPSTAFVPPCQLSSVSPVGPEMH